MEWYNDGGGGIVLMLGCVLENWDDTVQNVLHWACRSACQKCGGVFCEKYARNV